MLGGRAVSDLVRAIGRGGPTLLQLRGQGTGDPVFLRAVQEAVETARAMGMTVIVNDRADIAVMAGADGVHLGQEDVPPSEVRRLMPDAIVGLSTSTLEQVAAAAGEPVDYLSFGPVFSPFDTAARDRDEGLARLTAAVARAHVPVVASGDVDDEFLAPLVAAGAAGIAVLSAIMNADDPEAATARLHARLARGSIRPR